MSVEKVIEFAKANKRAVGLGLGGGAALVLVDSLMAQPATTGPGGMPADGMAGLGSGSDGMQGAYGQAACHGQGEVPGQGSGQGQGQASSERGQGRFVDGIYGGTTRDGGGVQARIDDGSAGYTGGYGNVVAVPNGGTPPHGYSPMHETYDAPQ